MLTTSSPATTAPDTTLKTPQSAVVICGPTASGKSTIAGNLAEAAVLEQLHGECSLGTADEARLVDLALLRQLTTRDHPVVVESPALARLLPVDNTVLIVQLTASTPVRTQRMQTRRPDTTFAEARHLLELTDTTACASLRATWGVDISDSQANRWRADLVVGCPHVRECSDELACTEIVTTLVTAAYNVYENYLTTDPAVSGEDAIKQFIHLCRMYPAHARRCRPALIRPVTDFTVAAWQNRMLNELDQRAGLL
jgi:cytidylate kinase